MTIIDTIVKILVGLIACIHLYIMWFEMFAWTSRGRRVFKDFPAELFPKTTKLAANLGLYNGFLASGLIWTFFITTQPWQHNVMLFFLSFIAIAGIYGALTAQRKIFFVQALPALITIILILL
ncbi:hypothetical protein COTS27_00257 [Spirochaetota bacterium]|nr:hypothetical protein COTS27_00257 [Spirochaetota bacterium]